VKIALLAIFHFVCAYKRPRNAKIASKNQRPNPRRGKGKPNAQNARQKSQSKNQKNASPKKKQPKIDQNRPRKPNNRGAIVNMRDFMEYSQYKIKDKGVLIAKDEPIGVIASNDSASYGVLATYVINPGNATTFPLLSQEAAVYETYRFEMLEFYTVPLVSEYATGGQTGEVAIAVNFNASLPQPATQTAMLTLEPVDANLPCLPLCIQCPSTAMHKQSNAKFVRTGNLPGQSDIKEYDVGNLYLTGEGLSASQFNACRLFVRYKCRLFTRVNLVNQGAPTNNSVSQFVSKASEALTTSVPYVMLFADVTGTDGYVNGLNITNTSGTLTPLAGNYLCNYYIQFTSNGNSTIFEGYLQKNSAVQPNSTVIPYYSLPSAAYAVYTITGSVYVSCSGTDTLKLYAGSNFSTGATTVDAILTITAI